MTDDTVLPDADNDGEEERTRVRRRTVRGVAMPDPGADTDTDAPAASRAGNRPLARDPFAVEDAEEDLDADDESGESGDTPDAEESDADESPDDESADDGEDTATSEEAATDDDVEASTEDGGSADEGEGAPRRRRRRRGRRGRGRGGRGNGGADEGSGGDDAPAAEATAETAEEEVDEDAGSRGRGGATQQRQKATSGKDGSGKDGSGKGAAGKRGSAKGSQDESDTDDTEEAADGSAKKDDGQDGDGRSGRRRRRGRRGRGRRGRGKKSGGQDEGAKQDQSTPTRLSARSNKGASGRRRVPTVSAETRRVIAESPPKRMLVTVGTERTQIAVLEERTLVEHYVTQASEESYVGNIYKGRVQNVLPGMEAAFVDIGKGRNGVLYAGEVNYDEADRDGGLPRIEQALKSGQTVLVQVTKDPMGTKGARLTQHLSLAGRYCVLAPGDDMLGISRKLPDEQRDRLRKVLKEVKPDGFGLIVRTAAENATAEQLQADVARLLERWKKVEEKAEKAKALESVYAEPQLVLRVIRDVFGPEHTQLVIDDATLADEVRDYLREVSPEHVDKVVTYAPPPSDDGTVQKLFDAYEVTTQIRRALEKKVWLKSGGYLIIEKTEAMWVIDVNTGKFVGKDNLEETVLRNNIEAAEEIARQLRLRDMGGIIVIDFVDMIVPANREEVLKRFKRELARDKTKSRVMEISKLGLVQMTRKNVSTGLMEAFTVETDDVIPGRRIVEDLLA